MPWRCPWKTTCLCGMPTVGPSIPGTLSTTRKTTMPANRLYPTGSPVLRTWGATLSQSTLQACAPVTSAFFLLCAVRTSDGPLADVPLHFVLLFPDNYPTQGPEIRLFHALPHPNIAAHTAGAAQSGGAAYRCALLTPFM